MNIHRRFYLNAALGVILCAMSAAQTTAHLETAHTRLEFQTGSSAPRLLSLQVPGESPWNNRALETLISSAEVEGQAVPLVWKFNPEASRIDAKSVAFVYDSVAPHLRLTWQWQIRSERGPMEHQIRIDSLDSREIWLPLQDSFVFDWNISPQDNLEQFYVEKGADTPSPIGTHLVPVANGYAWEGLSSSYAHPHAGEWREIIPYFLVERTDASRSGWYAGIEFSARTRLTVVRDGGSLHGAVGLNPNPGPYRTRLVPGGSFETPTIFLGATSGGPDATGNVLRRWVREVLGTPDSWKNPNYPQMVNNSWGSGMIINEELAHRMDVVRTLGSQQGVLELQPRRNATLAQPFVKTVVVTSDVVYVFWVPKEQLEDIVQNPEG